MPSTGWVQSAVVVQSVHCAMAFDERHNKDIVVRAMAACSHSAIANQHATKDVSGTCIIWKHIKEMQEYSMQVEKNSKEISVSEGKFPCDCIVQCIVSNDIPPLAREKSRLRPREFENLLYNFQGKTAKSSV